VREHVESMAEKIAGWGIRTVQEVQKERIVILPDMLRIMMKQEELKVIRTRIEVARSLQSLDLGLRNPD
jgi:hypothetical protein